LGTSGGTTDDGIMHCFFGFSFKPTVCVASFHEDISLCRYPRPQDDVNISDPDDFFPFYGKDSSFFVPITRSTEHADYLKN
jgi:hypothetical protein